MEYRPPVPRDTILHLGKKRSRSQIGAMPLSTNMFSDIINNPKKLSQSGKSIIFFVFLE